jgi:SAM-dependent methyltransferase
MPKSPRRRKEWWRSFFGPLAGEVMFDPKMGKTTETEIDAILARVALRPRAAVLDVPCGAGRHAIALAKRGHDIVGLDYAKTYLAEARRAARKAGVATRTRFLRGDMRRVARLVPAGKFDLALSLYNSFGYFDRRSDDLKVVRGIYRALAPGGVFVVNTLQESGVRLRLAEPRNIGHEPMPNVFVIDQARYDPRTRRTQGRWTLVDARKRRARIERLQLRQHVYSHAALARLLRKAGFRVIARWGMLHGTPLTPQSWHQTIAARKPKSAPR